MNIDDKVLEGQHSHGAEVGHMKIDLGKNRRCGCGRWGCLEAYASATAVVSEPPRPRVVTLRSVDMPWKPATRTM